ncbi:MAG: cupin domain-containing protein [Pedobacter sp.]|nr:cupin domain-containing protein [Pedobacter sp.]
MNLKSYIESGIIEWYVLNDLPVDEKRGFERMLRTYPELREELNAIELALQSYATSQKIMPPHYLQEKVVKSLLNLEKEKAMDIEDLPLIDRFSDYKNWLPMVERLGELPLADDGRCVKILRCDEQVTQTLIVSTTDIEEETHEDEYESFLILSGACKCTIGDNIRFMEAGDYMEIPLHMLHNVALVSESVVAILQRIRR